MSEKEIGAYKYIRVSFCTDTKPCRCVDCTWMDPDVDNLCYARTSDMGGVEIPEPEAKLDYCEYFDRKME